jgi:chondroitin AC lyase
MKFVSVLLAALCLSFGYAAADISMIKQRLHSDAVAQGNVSDVEKYVSLMRKDGSFEDLDYEFATNQGIRDLRSHSSRLHSMACAFILPKEDNRYYNDSQLLSQIVSGWRWLGFEAPESRSPNWWWGKIGLPSELWKGLVLVDSEVGQDVIGAIYDKYSVRTNAWLPEEAKDNNAGANLTDRAVVALTESVLRGDSKKLKEVREMLEMELCDFKGHHGAGVRPDMSFHQHPIIAGQGNPLRRVQYYPGGYGTGYAQQVSRLAVWLKDTQYQLSDKAVDTIISYVLDGQQWVMRGATFAPSSVGRSISRRGSVLSSCSEAMVNAVEKIIIFGKRTDELNAYLKRMQNPSFEKDITGNRMFRQSDVMIHRRPEYMFSLRMISERTVRPETSASENKKGYYLGDGFTTVMLDGSEYGARVGEEIFPCWDWELLPGTTTDHTGDVPFAPVNVPFPSDTVLESVGQSDFVGGVSNGVYGTAVMDYKRHNVDVSAKKSWFFFDDYIVALGADINYSSQSAGNVRSSVNQIKLKGDVVYSQSGMVKKLSRPQRIENSKIDWVHHRNTGYIVAANDSVSLYAENRSGKWSDIGGNSGEASSDIFTLVVEHGERPQGASYEYVIVPGISGTQMRTFYGAAPFEVIENSPSVQAVFDKNAGVFQAVFYAPGSLEMREDIRIRTDKPIAIMIYSEDGKVNLRAADPSQKLTECRLDIKLNPVCFGDRLNQRDIQAVVDIVFPEGLYAGSSVLHVID